MQSEQFTPYAERRPAAAGKYLWRVPSRAVPGLTVQVRDEMRQRSAGYEQVLSPSFDYWDGYRILVPEGLAWAEDDGGAKLRLFKDSVPLDIPACPLCGKVPQVKAVERAGSGGVMIGMRPESLNSFWLECCEWGGTPHMDDPFTLLAKRNVLLGVARPIGQKDVRDA